MTKKQMIDYIENSGMVIDFSRAYYMSRRKEFVERHYNMAVEYNRRKKVEA